jgi:hypothetical protein
MAGAVIAVAGLALIAAGPSKDQAPGRIVRDVAFVALAALPAAIGVGILKYHLYDIDRLISRTLSYTLVTGVLIGVYAGVVTLATRVLPFSSPVGVAASTLAVAALFNPVRHRVQRAVDRRFNRARYDAEVIVAAFAARLMAAHCPQCQCISVDIWPACPRGPGAPGPAARVRSLPAGGRSPRCRQPGVRHPGHA